MHPIFIDSLETNCCQHRQRLWPCCRKLSLCGPMWPNVWPVTPYHRTKIYGPHSDSPNPIPIPAPIPTLVPTPQALTLTTLQLQWLQEDLRVTIPISPTPTYH